MRRLVPLALVALVLAACGAPTPPAPDPDLTLTGATPAVALPGASVVLQGTGFESGQAVTFDGVAATVTAVTDTTITVTVPATYGYPRIAVEDVAKEKLLYVGEVYAGDANLDAVQAALDLLPENAALRLPAGTYAAPGTSLDLDNRKLYGVGVTTVLDTPDGLRTYARGTNVTVLGDLAVTGAGDFQVYRGRLATADAPIWASGTVMLHGLEASFASFDLGSDYVHVVVRDADVDANNVYTNSTASSSVWIEGSEFDVAFDWTMYHYGQLTVRDSSIALGTDMYLYMDYLAGIAFEGTDVVAGGYIYMYSYDSTVPGPLRVVDSTLTAGDYVELTAEHVPLVVTGTAIEAVNAVLFYGYDYGAPMAFDDVTITAGAEALFSGYAGLTMTGSTVTAGTYVYFDLYGAVDVADTSLTAETEYIYAYADYNAVVSFVGVAASAASYIDVSAYGPVRVVGGSLVAGGYLQLYSSYAGDITVRDTTAITVGDYFNLYDGSFSYAGNNGILTFEGNAATTVGNYLDFLSPYSDLLVRGNGPIEVAGTITLSGQYSHVTLTDNELLEAGADVNVFAANVGGRIVATGNAFVANAGAGTITLETQAGELTESGNTFDGTLVTPNN